MDTYIYSTSAIAAGQIASQTVTAGTGVSYVSIAGSGSYTYTIPAPATAGYVNISAGGVSVSNPFNIGTFGAAMKGPSPNVLTLSNAGKEIVRINKDGSVTWNGDTDINEAADAFSKAMSLGSEHIAGITQGVKQRMRDSVFNDLIEIAKEKGSLSADDLTYLLSAAKIMEKLKGPRD
jgi:hypothetical protein